MRTETERLQTKTSSVGTFDRAPGIWMVGLVVATMAWALGLAGTAAAQPVDSSETGSGARQSRCDASLGSTTLVGGRAAFAGPGMTANRSRTLPLRVPVGPGHVVASGVVADPHHVPFDLDHQQGEQVRLTLLDRTGAELATTASTVDLADAATEAHFRLPSVQLERPAVALRVEHVGAGAYAASSNSLLVPCINVEEVDPTSPPNERWRPFPCPSHIDAPRGTTCGHLAVPESRSTPDSRLIQIAAAVLPAQRPTTRAPVFYFEGGPGGAATAVASLLVDLGPALRRQDLVVIDQRGTGLSTPNLSCGDDEAEADIAVLAPLVATCRARLVTDGVDLAAYSTAAAAADAAELRAALGYRQWNLFGTSYGTSVASAVLADHPEGVRSAVLDSAFPPQVNFVADAPGATHRILDDLVARCAAEVGCAQAFPNLRGDIITAVTRLQNRPVRFPEESVDQVGFTELDGRLLVDLISRSISDVNLPAFVHALAVRTPAGQARALADLAAFELPKPAAPTGPAAPSDAPTVPLPSVAEQPSTGLYLSVLCAEEVEPDRDAFFAEPSTKWSPLLDRLFQLSANGKELERLCEIWDVPAVRGADAPVRSEVPVLILAAEDDAITPVRWSRLAAQGFDRSQLAVFPAGGHVLFGDPCADVIMSSFVTRPRQRVDRKCLDNVEAEPYARFLPRPPANAR